MPFDGLLLHGLASELRASLLHMRVEKIHMPENHELVIGFRNKLQLFISIQGAQPRVYLTSQRFENPMSPPMLCMLLRKLLIGAKLLDIRQQGFDRILIFDFEASNDFGEKTMKSLIVEIMGKHSNAILIETESGRIIEAMKRVSPLMSSREISPGLIFKPLETTKTSLFDFEGFDDSISIAPLTLTSEKYLLGRFEGFSPVIAKEMCLMSHIDPKMPVVKLGLLELETLQKNLSTLKKRLLDETYRPTLFQLEKTIDFHILPLTLFEGSKAETTFPTISALIEAYYSRSSQTNRIQQKGQHLNKLVAGRIEKLYLKIDKLLEDQTRANEAEIYQLYGELIISHLYLAKPGMNALDVLNYYTGEPMTIPMDLRLTANQNAQNYYKKYQKSKKAKQEILVQLEETETEIRYLEQVLTLLENAEDYLSVELIADELAVSGYIKRSHTKKTHKKSTVRPHSFQSEDGILILVGRNNLENDQLTLKDADNRDLWFHTKNIPGSHVIAKCAGKPVSDQTLLMAAQLAAAYSKGKNGNRIEVDYTEIRNVKKPKGAKPGMVIYDHHQTLIVDPYPLN